MINKYTLGLHLPTDPRWVNMADMNLEDILTDHAWCEQKAATYGISLINFNSERTELVRVVAPIVAEEWGHFRQVLAEMDKRGLKLGRQRKDEYVNGLLGFNRSGMGREEALVEKLLMLALIEARSCERFRLLSLHLPDESLRRFYHKFMISEAGHYRTYLDLAKQYQPEDVVMKRWQEWLAFEVELLKTFTPRGDRMH